MNPIRQVEQEIAALDARDRLKDLLVAAILRRQAALDQIKALRLGLKPCDRKGLKTPIPAGVYSEVVGPVQTGPCWKDLPPQRVVYYVDSMDLEQLRDQDRADFIAAHWCGPCRSNEPAVHKIWPLRRKKGALGATVARLARRLLATEET